MAIAAKIPSGTAHLNPEEGRLLPGCAEISNKGRGHKSPLRGCQCHPKPPFLSRKTSSLREGGKRPLSPHPSTVMSPDARHLSLRPFPPGLGNSLPELSLIHI